MRTKFGPTTVTTAGTRVQLSTALDDVKHIQFQARAANTGRLFVGLVDVSSTVGGWELPIPSTTRTHERLDLDFGVGSVKLNLFYVDSTVNGEILDWVAIVSP